MYYQFQKQTRACDTERKQKLLPKVKYFQLCEQFCILLSNNVSQGVFIFHFVKFDLTGLFLQMNPFIQHFLLIY